MTELLKEYLKFAKKNEAKLKEATSDYAYEEDTYFECYYDAARDLVQVHCHGGCEITDSLSTPEELDEYQEELDGCVEELEFDKTLD